MIPGRTISGTIQSTEGICESSSINAIFATEPEELLPEDPTLCPEPFLDTALMTEIMCRFADFTRASSSLEAWRNVLCPLSVRHSKNKPPWQTYAERFMALAETQANSYLLSEDVKIQEMNNRFARMFELLVRRKQPTRSADIIGEDIGALLDTKDIRALLKALCLAIKTPGKIGCKCRLTKLEPDVLGCAVKLGEHRYTPIKEAIHVDGGVRYLATSGHNLFILTSESIYTYNLSSRIAVGEQRVVKCTVDAYISWSDVVGFVYSSEHLLVFSRKQDDSQTVLTVLRAIGPASWTRTFVSGQELLAEYDVFTSDGRYLFAANSRALAISIFCVDAVHISYRRSVVLKMEPGKMLSSFKLYCDSLVISIMIPSGQANDARSVWQVEHFSLADGSHLQGNSLEMDDEVVAWTGDGWNGCTWMVTKDHLLRVPVVGPRATWLHGVSLDTGKWLERLEFTEDNECCELVQGITDYLDYYTSHLMGCLSLGRASRDSQAEKYDKCREGISFLVPTTREAVLAIIDSLTLVVAEIKKGDTKPYYQTLLCNLVRLLSLNVVAYWKYGGETFTLAENVLRVVEEILASSELAFARRVVIMLVGDCFEPLFSASGSPFDKVFEMIVTCGDPDIVYSFMGCIRICPSFSRCFTESACRRIFKSRIRKLSMNEHMSDDDMLLLETFLIQTFLYLRNGNSVDTNRHMAFVTLSTILTDEFTAFLLKNSAGGLVASHPLISFFRKWMVLVRALVKTQNNASFFLSLIHSLYSLISKLISKAHLEVCVQGDRMLCAHILQLELFSLFLQYLTVFLDDSSCDTRNNQMILFSVIKNNITSESFEQAHSAIQSGLGVPENLQPDVETARLFWKTYSEVKPEVLLKCVDYVASSNRRARLLGKLSNEWKQAELFCLIAFSYHCGSLGELTELIQAAANDEIQQQQIPSNVANVLDPVLKVIRTLKAKAQKRTSRKPGKNANKILKRLSGKCTLLFLLSSLQHGNEASAVSSQLEKFLSSGTAKAILQAAAEDQDVRRRARVAISLSILLLQSNDHVLSSILLLDRFQATDLPSKIVSSLGVTQEKSGSESLGLNTLRKLFDQLNVMARRSDSDHSLHVVVIFCLNMFIELADMFPDEAVKQLYSLVEVLSRDSVSQQVKILVVSGFCEIYKRSPSIAKCPMFPKLVENILRWTSNDNATGFAIFRLLRRASAEFACPVTPARLLEFLDGGAAKNIPIAVPLLEDLIESADKTNQEHSFRIAIRHIGQRACCDCKDDQEAEVSIYHMIRLMRNLLMKGNSTLRAVMTEILRLFRPGSSQFQATNYTIVDVIAVVAILSTVFDVPQPYSVIRSEQRGTMFFITHNASEQQVYEGVELPIEVSSTRSTLPYGKGNAVQVSDGLSISIFPDLEELIPYYFHYLRSVPAGLLRHCLAYYLFDSFRFVLETSNDFKRLFEEQARMPPKELRLCTRSSGMFWKLLRLNWRLNAHGFGAGLREPEFASIGPPGSGEALPHRLLCKCGYAVFITPMVIDSSLKIDFSGCSKFDVGLGTVSEDSARDSLIFNGTSRSPKQIIVTMDSESRKGVISDGSKGTVIAERVLDEAALGFVVVLYGHTEVPFQISATTKPATISLHGTAVFKRTPQGRPMQLGDLSGVKPITNAHKDCAHETRRRIPSKVHQFQMLESEKEFVPNLWFNEAVLPVNVANMCLYTASRHHAYDAHEALCLFLLSRYEIELNDVLRALHLPRDGIIDLWLYLVKLWETPVVPEVSVPYSALGHSLVDFDDLSLSKPRKSVQLSKSIERLTKEIVSDERLMDLLMQKLSDIVRDCGLCSAGNSANYALHIGPKKSEQVSLNPPFTACLVFQAVPNSSDSNAIVEIGQNQIFPVDGIGLVCAKDFRVTSIQGLILLPISPDNLLACLDGTFWECLVAIKRIVWLLTENQVKLAYKHSLYVSIISLLGVDWPFLRQWGAVIVRYVTAKIPISFSIVQGDVPRNVLFLSGSPRMAVPYVAAFVEELLLIVDFGKFIGMAAHFPELLTDAFKQDLESLPKKPFVVQRVFGSTSEAANDTGRLLALFKKIFQPSTGGYQYPFFLLIERWARITWKYPCVTMRRCETNNAVEIVFDLFTPDTISLHVRGITTVFYCYDEQFIGNASKSAKYKDKIELRGDHLFLWCEENVSIDKFNCTITTCGEPGNLRMFVQKYRDCFISDIKMMLSPESTKVDQYILKTFSTDMFSSKSDNFETSLEHVLSQEIWRENLTMLRADLLFRLNLLLFTGSKVSEDIVDPVLRQFLAPTLKLSSFQRLIKSVSCQPNLSIDRKKGFEVRVGECADLESTVIAQLTRAYFANNPRDFRNSSEAPWRVTFAREAGVDAGGLARDLMSEFAADLRAVKCGFMVPVPNAARTFSENRDSLIPISSPSMRDPAKKYHVIGVVIGMCIRTGLVQPFMFPQFVWDYLVRGKLAIDAIFEIDTSYAALIQKMQKAIEDGISKEEFDELFHQNFVVVNSVGVQIPLCVNGQNTKVTLDNCLSYIQLANDFRLKEIEGNLAAMRKGLWENLDIEVPWSLDGETLEIAACGSKEIPVSLLKKITHFVNIAPEQQQLLWQVLESFTSEQRSLYLKFLSGRTRLPANAVNKVNLKVDAMGGVDILPTASTCFHALHYPRYTSFETARKRLLVAMEYCGTMETS